MNNLNAKVFTSFYELLFYEVLLNTISDADILSCIFGLG